MSSCNTVFILGLIAISFVLAAVSAWTYIIRWVFGIRSGKEQRKSGIGQALLFSAFLFVSLWSLKYALGYYSVITTASAVKPEDITLNAWEEITRSLVHSLKTFGIDDTYTDYIISGKAMFRELIGEYCLTEWLYSWHVSYLNIAAPVAGGAIVFEIIAGVFPKFVLFLSRFKGWRPKYYFSEMNEAALALVKSIDAEASKSRKRPVFIFTDTYVDSADEKQSELYCEAKRYGVICIRDDIAHVARPFFGKSEYYLMNENELDNLDMLIRLTECNDLKRLRNARIYLFVSSDAYVKVEKEVNDKFSKSGLFDDNVPVVIPIRTWRNLVHNLFLEVPLYEPLVHKKDPSKLNVTIFGNGSIGTEAFLGAYWYGQMLVGGKEGDVSEITQCDMTVRVVSKDSEDVFWSKIDFINPEIKKTVNVLGNNPCAADSRILACDSDGTPGKAYCNVQYIQADIKTDGLWNGNDEAIKAVLESDYFVVALGSDADNISIAEKIRCHVGKKHFECGDTAGVNNTVIAYAVFDSDVAATLNQNRHYKCSTKKYTDKCKSDIYTYAFGSLNQMYSFENIQMSKSTVWAQSTGEAYLKAQMRDDLVRDNKKRASNADKNYNYWADLARAMHVRYKVFSLGLIDTSVFDGSSAEDDLIHEDNVKAICEEYRLACKAFKGKGERQAICDRMEKVQECFAWLEHRRWNAFTRTMGFQHTAEYKSSYDMFKNHKNMELKLHPCLVESKFPDVQTGEKYMHSDKTMGELYKSLGQMDNGVDPKTGIIDRKKRTAYLTALMEFEDSKKPLFDKVKKEYHDLLDEVSYNCYRYAIDINKGILEEELEMIKTDPKYTKWDKDQYSLIYCYDFKMYDYFTGEFD